MGTDTVKEMKVAKLRGGDLGYSWDKCKRCFYLATLAGINQPMNGFPAVYGQIEKQVREFFGKNNLQDIYKEFPAGVILDSNKSVDSMPVEFVDLNMSLYISGRYDDLVQLDDGSFMLLKFATSKPVDEKIEQTTRQLNAYAWAIQNACKPDKKKNITRLGVAVFDPVKFIKGNPQDYFFEFVEIPYQPDEFAKFLREVAELLSKDEAPEPTIASTQKDTCGFCARDNQIIEMMRKAQEEKLKEIVV